MSSTIQQQRATSPSPGLLLIWDADCGFCRKWVERWRRITDSKIEAQPYQSVAERFPEIPLSSFQQAVHFIAPDGRIYRAAAAVFKSMEGIRGWGLFWSAYQRIPLFDRIAEFLYGLIARNRALASKWLP